MSQATLGSFNGGAMKIDAYRNLQDDCISIKCREGERYGQVVEHAEKVWIQSPEFVIQESGQRKARETGRRNAHAFVRGKWNDRLRVINGTHITYDPFKYDHFVEVESERPVESADYCAVTTDGVFAKGVVYK